VGPECACPPNRRQVASLAGRVNKAHALYIIGQGSARQASMTERPVVLPPDKPGSATMARDYPTYLGFCVSHPTVEDIAEGTETTLNSRQISADDCGRKELITKVDLLLETDTRMRYSPLPR
jgi:hypothetical protein